MRRVAAVAVLLIGLTPIASAGQWKPLQPAEASHSLRQVDPQGLQVKFRGRGPEFWWNVAHARKLQLQVRWQPTVEYALRLASAAYGVSYWQLSSVASCESHRSPFSVNRSSGASGLFQFLGSTWRAQGMAGFSVFDPVAAALATARIVSREGWRQWTCRP